MPIIDSQKLPQEIKDKYSIVNNSLRLVDIKNAELDKYKKEPKDEINTIVGDDKQPDIFYPQLKICRWSNEVNLSVRLKDTEYDKALITTNKDKITWDKGNTKIEFYDYTEGEGGYKMVWYLKSKPATNKVEFTIQSKGLDFFYQPPLTQEYQNGYSEEFGREIVVTETQVKDLEGNVLVNRPENVVGSYAVYHSTKGGMNDTYGKDYKVGKPFHIYRPKLIDATGKETWGILKIENGIYSVEIPQDFLDKAKMPIKSNDAFGYQDIGESYRYIMEKFNWGGEITIYESRMGNEFYPDSNGTLDNIKFYGGGDVAVYVKGLVNETDTANWTHDEIDKSNGIQCSTDVEWKTLGLNGESIVQNINYILNVVGKASGLANPPIDEAYKYHYYYDNYSLPNAFEEEAEEGVDIYTNPQNPWENEPDEHVSKISSWEISTDYYEEDYVENDGAYYGCYNNHTSSANDEPGVGANWEDYWYVGDWHLKSIYADYTPSGGGTNITIDGTEVTSITIDGTPVVSVTIDGDTVF